MSFREIIETSPNCDRTQRHECLGVCFHHSAETFADTRAIIADATRKVSYHCAIDLDGTRCTFVDDEHIAWHAGISHFRGRDSCNFFLLGCSFAGNTWRSPLSDAQLDSAIEWLDVRWNRYSWSADWMTDHRQIAPKRKDDLNPTEWTRLLNSITDRWPPP